jgi:hypothetical protein
MALDPCDEANGCLEVVPGSHEWPVLCTIAADTRLSFTDITVPLPDDAALVPVLMEPGDVLFFNGSLVHGKGRRVGCRAHRDGRRPARGRVWLRPPSRLVDQEAARGTACVRLHGLVDSGLGGTGQAGEPVTEANTAEEECCGRMLSSVLT